MQYKLLALDIDGTLLNSQRQLTARTAKAVRQVAASGIKVCLVSGRRARSMTQFAQELGLDDPLVSYNGGAIVQPADYTYLHAETIPYAAVLPIISAWEQAGLPVIIFRGTSEQPDVFASGSSSWQQKYFEYEASRGNLLRQPTLTTGVDWDPLRVYTAGDQSLGQMAATLANPLIDPKVMKVFATQDYDGTHYYEIYSAKSSKANGLRWLEQYYGISQKEMIAVGDHINDLDMIEHAGLGVAMGNAQPEVKAVANLVIGHHDEDGLAAFLESFLLDQPGE